MCPDGYTDPFIGSRFTLMEYLTACSHRHSYYKTPHLDENAFITKLTSGYRRLCLFDTSLILTTSLNV